MIFQKLSQVFAADIELPIGEMATKNNFFGYTCIGHLVSNLVAAAFIVAGIAFFVYLVMGGIQWLTSGGDKGKIESSQKMISAALIGLAIVASSYAVYMIVLTFFGINLDALCTDNPLGN
ncbi:hypothetical protein A3K29_00995 [Candidatus Collierbacteria bacterium RIFOXYB2_FULL_46_14]|uniref:Integral membrane protein n=1 Tax=Candidatus Collierbacteria bacterium GW2011_GWA2_46_26 TaxID=1618381 RepID=A0A0G1RTJ9_9BACT|nr:MAG: hypothetical protein UW29_C0003G0030 [Candidatus Collierbacteria bacterium GW2011_GWC2_44_13]KKU33288.1 MAG: hypothetical protein UX47_C0005G0090 [Candidatus Collierbacteria bacterium GW2011_GWA2_46_26]OGD72708.1 MAG: hypothetical protein A3K29_00995 [Candidatus Collierbacteria bacterium RIFOXYB2_FULL_46_14]OGD75750.1 MAG: hypothetical protein A3K43_00995 [Candidatus Collierbacteria bacterium RIFOXYA2_FULL_46_20]OGD77086.1 MAG: hypothetical protein A3K39_00995 [Candidatus Collierbacteri